MRFEFLMVLLVSREDREGRGGRGKRESGLISPGGTFGQG